MKRLSLNVKWKIFLVLAVVISFLGFYFHNSLGIGVGAVFLGMGLAIFYKIRKAKQL